MYARVCARTGNDFFLTGAAWRTISLNADYIVFMKNPRDKLQFDHLSRQMFPHALREVRQIYENETARPFSYLVVDLRQRCAESERIFNKVFRGEKGPRCYTPVTRDSSKTTTRKRKWSTL